MKTTIPRKISTVDQANKFINDLAKNGELFHFDDDPSEIINASRKFSFTKEECVKLRSAVSDMRNLNNFDMFESALESLNKL